MILSEREIRKIVLLTMKNNPELVKEIKMGAIDSGVNFEMCNLSDIPDSIWKYYNALRQGNKQKFLEQLEKDIQAAENKEFTIFKGLREKRNQDEIERLKKRKEDIENDKGGWLELTSKMKGNVSSSRKLGSGNFLFNVTQLALMTGGFALSALGVSKQRCDNIKEILFYFLNDILGPFLGIKIDASSVQDFKKVKDKNKKKGSYEKKGYADFLSDFDFGLQDVGLIDDDLRKELVMSMDVSKYNLVYFDIFLFEYFANDSYVKLCQNKKIDEDDLKTAKAKIKFAKEKLKESKPSSYKDIWVTMRRYLDLDDSQSQRKNYFVGYCEEFKWGDYFKNADEAYRLINQRFAVILSFLKRF